jgi:hypothetical protein
MNLSQALKRKRDAEDRLRHNSQQPTFAETDAGAQSFTDTSQLAAEIATKPDDFLELMDTPDAYTNQGGKIVGVKVDESGLGFVATPSAANGLPIGGIAGQVPSKIDDTDFNVQWSDVDAQKIKSKAISISDFTGKNGYLLAYDGTNDCFYLKADEEGGGGSGSYTEFELIWTYILLDAGLILTNVVKP